MIHTGKHRALIAEAGARLYVTFTDDHFEAPGKKNPRWSCHHGDPNWSLSLSQKRP